MAFDQTTRNRLQRFVSDARATLTEEFTRQLQNEYGLDPVSASVAPMERLSNLDDARRETAQILRDTLEHYRQTSPSEDLGALLDRIVREHAFTVLNRLAALRMAEARGLLIESLAEGYNSKGFQLYARLTRTGLGERGDAYSSYLFSLFDEFALDLRVLFDRFAPTGRLFPREPALLETLALMNDPEIAPLWAEDETIGWIYQYFNSKEERKKMRDESAAPRNSRELAVRNQTVVPAAPSPSPTSTAMTVSISTPPGADIDHGYVPRLLTSGAPHTRGKFRLHRCVALGRRGLLRARAARSLAREVGCRREGHWAKRFGTSRVQGNVE